jgi:hypothetical protein
VKGKKLKNNSKYLNRMFHMDVFSSNAKPKGVVLWLGGSGMTKEKYNDRGKTVIPIFDKAWNRLGQELPLIFIFVTAPYDIRFAGFSKFIDDKNRWNQHVEKDILSNWLDLPIYLIGNSGGIALALNGVHKISRVVGVGGLGADQIPADFQIPLGPNSEPKWVLNLYYNYNDNVYDNNKNMIDKLIERGLVVCDRFEGEHETDHYIRNRSFDDLIRKADKSFNRAP